MKAYKILLEEVQKLKDELAKRSGYTGYIQRQEVEYWETKYWNLLKWREDQSSNYHAVIRARGLEKLNQDQAGMLMAIDQQIRAYEKVYEELPYHQIKPVIHWEWPDGWYGKRGMPRLSGGYYCKKCKLGGHISTLKLYKCIDVIGEEPKLISTGEMVTQLTLKPAKANALEVADRLQNHIYEVWPNRKKAPLPGGFYEYVLRAVQLLRKKDMVRKKDDPVADEEVTEAEIIEHPKLQLMQGGKGGGTNWLKELPVGTVFLAKKRGDMEFVCHQFVLDWKGKRGALLTSNLPSKAEVPVDMLAFSMLHEQVEIQRLGFEDINVE